MKQVLRRVTALTLAMAMSLSLLSANVWAAELEPAEDGAASSVQSSEEHEGHTHEEEAPEEEEASDKEEESSGEEDKTSDKGEESSDEGGQASDEAALTPAEVPAEPDDGEAAPGAEGEEAEAPGAGERITVKGEKLRFVPKKYKNLDPMEAMAAYDGESLSVQDDEDPGPAGSRLEDNDLMAYLALRRQIAEVAAGRRDSAEFSVTAEDLGLPQTWTKEALNVDVITEDVVRQLMAGQASVDMGAVVNALLADEPFRLFWYDKTKGCEGYSFSCTYSSEEVTLEGYIGFSFYVSQDYSSDGAQGSFLADTDKCDAVSTAADNAYYIVTGHEGESDFDKLNNYREEICDRVSYNKGAAENQNTPYGDPWQCVWVFDNDDDTNVVCEGYSKAFQYLCDRSEFDDPNVRCISVSGTMTGGTGAGPHMWNVVRMEDYANYLVDVTNCDEGSVGAPDLLFLTGAEGSVAGGYTCAVENDSVSYEYDEDTGKTFGSDDLTLSATRYQANGGGNQNQDEQSGNAGEQSGNAGEESGNAGEQSGNAGEESGNAGEESGNAGEQSGNAGEQSGNAGEQSGNAGEQSGSESWLENQIGANLFWSYDESTQTLSITGTGAMKDFYSTYQVPWYDFNSQIAHIVLPQGLTTVGSNAFQFCWSVQEVDIPASVEYIGDYGFAYSAISEVNFGSEATSFEENAFEGTPWDQERKLRNGTFIELGETCEWSVPRYGGQEYYYRFHPDGDGLYRLRVESPGSNESWYVYPSVYDEQMKPIQSERTSLDSDHPTASVLLWGDDTLYLKLTVSQYSSDEPLPLRFSMEKMNQPESGSCGEGVEWSYDSDTLTLTISGSGAVQDYGSAGETPWNRLRETKRVVISEGVTAVGANAFSEIGSIESVDFPDSLTSIGAYAFAYSGLSELSLGDKVQCADTAFVGTPWYDQKEREKAPELSLGDTQETFSGSTGHNYRFTPAKDGDYLVSLRSNTEPWSGDVSLWELDHTDINLDSVYVADHQYRYTLQGGKTYHVRMYAYLFSGSEATVTLNISEYAYPGETQGSIGDKLSWSYDGGSSTLTISGSGAMPNRREEDSRLWTVPTSLIESVVVQEGVTSVGTYCFDNLSSLKSVTLASSVGQVGAGAFEYCSALSQVQMGEDTSWPASAFQGTPWFEAYQRERAETVTQNSDRTLSFDGSGQEFSFYFVAPEDGLYAPTLTGTGLADWSCDVYDEGNRYVSEQTNGTQKVYPLEEGERYLFCVRADAYQGTASFRVVSSQAQTQGSCGDELTWQFDRDSGVMTLSGTGDMDNYRFYSNNRAPWTSLREEIRSLEVGDGVASIGINAFAYCGNLSTVNFHNPETSYDRDAFLGTPWLAAQDHADAVSLTLDTPLTVRYDRDKGKIFAFQPEEDGTYLFYFTNKLSNYGSFGGYFNTSLTDAAGKTLASNEDTGTVRLFCDLEAGKTCYLSYRLVDTQPPLKWDVAVKKVKNVEVTVSDWEGNSRSGQSFAQIRCTSGAMSGWQRIAAAVSKEIVPATATEDARKVITSSFTLGGQVYSNVESVPVFLSHVHSMTQTQATAATCGQAGNIAYWTCSGCQKHFRDEEGAEEIALEDTVIPATGAHSWNDGVITTAATCHSDGLRTYTCQNCQKTLTAVIPATGEHSWNAGEVTKEANCHETGTLTKTCSDCDATDTVEIPINPNSHDGGTELRGVKAATCTAEGYTGDTYCKGCGAKIGTGQATSKAEHTWDNGEVTKAATCTEKGEKRFTCTVCGAAKTEETDIDSDNHQGWTEPEEWTTAPTCHSNGVKTFTCACGQETKLVEIAGLDAANHDGDTEVRDARAATCAREGYTGDVYCKGCNKLKAQGTAIPATGEHTWDEGEITTEPTRTSAGVRTYTCTVCGQTRTESVYWNVYHEHSYGAPTFHWAGDRQSCTATFACTVCGKEKESERCTVTDTRKEATCQRAGAVYHTAKVTSGGIEYKDVVTEVIPVTDHNWDSGTVTPATCQAQGYTTYKCQDCQVTRIGDVTPMTGHSWDNGAVTRAATCTEKGVKTYTCTACNAKRTESIPATGHSWGDDEVTAATCTAGGFTAKTCSGCGATQITGRTDPLGHDYQVQRSEPTCVANGSETYTCSRCHDSYTNALSATGAHQWQAKGEPVAATCQERGYTLYECQTCQATKKDDFTDKLPHRFVGEVTREPTATEPGLRTYTCANAGCNEHYTEDIEAITYSGTCGNGMTWTLSGGVLTITGTGDLDGVFLNIILEALRSMNPQEAVMPQEGEEADIVKQVVVGSGVTGLGNDAFKGMTRLESVSLPETLKSVGDGAFQGTGVESVKLPDSVESVGKGAFENCARLNKVILGSSLGTIKQNAFNNCAKLKSVSVPDNVGQIGDNAFNGNVNLRASLDSAAAQYAAGNGDLVTLTVTDDCANGHSWDQGAVTEPTCKSGGWTTYTCTACGESYKADFTSVNESGHKWDRGVVTAPTCKSGGWTTYTCTACGESYKADFTSVNESGHRWDRGVVTAPTCAAKGYTTYTCTNDNCNASYKTDYTNTIAHVWVEDTQRYQAATCQQAGKRVYRCSNCEQTREELLPKAAHSYQAAYTAPTCTTQGYTTYTCTTAGCDESYTANYESAKGHTPAEAVRENETAPTYNAAGSYDSVVKCSVCGAELSRTPVSVPALGTTSLELCTLSVDGTDLTWDGNEKRPQVTVKFGDQVLEADRDYTVSYSNNNAVGTATVTVTGQEAYEGVMTQDFQITAAPAKTNLSQCTVTLSYDSVEADGKAKEPAVAVKDGDKTLTKGQDYSLSYTDNGKPGTAKVTVTGMGDAYTGSVEKTFTIAHTSCSWDGGAVTKQANCHEKGAKTYTCTVCGKTRTEAIPTDASKHDGGTELRNAKSAAVGQAGYTGDTCCKGCGAVLTKGAAIPALPAPAPAEKAENVITAADVVRGYSAKKQTLNLGASALEGAALSYVSGNGKVQVDGAGNVTIGKKFAGTVSITITAAETGSYKLTQRVITLTVPTKAKLSKVKAEKGQMTVQWKKNNTGTGYEIQYSTDKKFKKKVKKVKVKKAATAKTTVKKLKKGTYYVRIRTVNGKFGSDWSKPKTVKIAK